MSSFVITSAVAAVHTTLSLSSLSGSAPTLAAGTCGGRVWHMPIACSEREAMADGCWGGLYRSQAFCHGLGRFCGAGKTRTRHGRGVCHRIDSGIKRNNAQRLGRQKSGDGVLAAGCRAINGGRHRGQRISLRLCRASHTTCDFRPAGAAASTYLKAP